MKVRRMMSVCAWQTFAWWRGRQYRLLLLGLPALVGGIAIVTLATAASLTPTQEIEARYFVQAENALKAKDYAKAYSCYDRLAYRGSEKPEVLFGMAQAAVGLEQTERASILMSELAPPNRAGYGPAHFWQANQLLRAPNSTPPLRKLAEAHLLHALEAHVNNEALVHSMLCKLYVQDRLWDQAEIHFIKSVKSYPELRLQGINIYKNRGEKQRADREAELAIAFFSARSAADSSDHFARLGWADATAFLQRFPKAIEILQEGYFQTREPDYPKIIACVYATWYETLSRDPADELDKRLPLLEEGLKYDPSNMGLLNFLLEVTKLGGSDGDRGRALLNAVLTRNATPMVHFAVGVAALQRGDTKLARLEWERALALSKTAPGLMSQVANNLAWMIATTPQANLALGLATGEAPRLVPAWLKEPDLDRALDLAKLAVENGPNELNFRHTRGFILYKMGRYREAVDDLETALPRFAESLELHLWLADIYDRLGNPGLAREHRRKAEEAKTVGKHAADKQSSSPNDAKAAAPRPEQ